MAGKSGDRFDCGGDAPRPKIIRAVAEFAGSNSPAGIPRELRLGFLMRQFPGRLPSEILREDMLMVQRARHALSVYDVAAESEKTGFTERFTTADWVIFKEIQTVMAEPND